MAGQASLLPRFRLHFMQLDIDSLGEVHTITRTYTCDISSVHKHMCNTQACNKYGGTFLSRHQLSKPLLSKLPDCLIREYGESLLF